MSKESEAWDKDYQQRGALWSGAVHHSPSFLPGSRVLELGCGNGKTLSSMVQQNVDIIAIDFSRCAVGMCKTILDSAPNGSACVADARNLPFVYGAFDGVIATHVLSHLQRPDRCVAASEAARMLKKGGFLYFSGFSTEDFRYGNGLVVEPGTIQNNIGISTHYFTEQEVIALFRDVTPQSVITQRWSLRVRGKEYPRAEIQAVFINEDPL